MLATQPDVRNAKPFRSDERIIRWPIVFSPQTLVFGSIRPKNISRYDLECVHVRIR